MAQHLLDNGYKDGAAVPVAVIASSSLQSLLRHLCDKHGPDHEMPIGNRNKAERGNADLAQAKAHDKSRQKHITA